MKILENLGLSILAIFAPIQAVVATTFILVVLDLITGVIAAKKRGEKLTSKGLKRSVGKLLLYETAIILSFLVQEYLTGDILPALKLVSALIGITELKSVLENLDNISGDRFFQIILSKVTQSQKDIEESDKK